MRLKNNVLKGLNSDLVIAFVLAAITMGFNGTFEKLFFCRNSALCLNYTPFRVVD